jgi:heterotetrameric sarcosine oxidase delta subunit
VSFLLTCPNCGVREVTDFGFGGEISARPTGQPSFRELNAYNYFRRNVAGVQREWWFHRSGCRAWFIAERDTRTNEVKFTALPGGEVAASRMTRARPIDAKPDAERAASPSGGDLP